MKIKIKKTFKKAFTLAEILVTLAILGVVFAALAPTVNTFNQERTEKEYKAKTGKAYSLLSEALRARFITDQHRMAGNSDASNLVEYILDSNSGAIKVTNRKDNGFKTRDGMVFAVRGENCHEQACFVIVDLDGKKRGKTQLNLDNMIDNFSVYRDASLASAKDADDGHSDIVVFMVKDGQVFPHSRYAADNMQMKRSTDTDFATSEINLQVRELNITTD